MSLIFDAPGGITRCRCKVCGKSTSWQHASQLCAECYARSQSDDSYAGPSKPCRCCGAKMARNSRYKYCYTCAKNYNMTDKEREY